jgi:hypothetical protein
LDKHTQVRDLAFDAEIGFSSAAIEVFRARVGDATAITKNQQFKPAVCATSAS